MEITAETVRRIDGILAAAQAQGRGMLYEHEVYGILHAIGLGVPRHRFVRDAREVTTEVLSAVGHTVMAKVVSPGIPHKQKLGGVKRVGAADPLYVQFVLTRMREEVLSHFAPGEAPAITGLVLWPVVGAFRFGMLQLQRVQGSGAQRPRAKPLGGSWRRYPHSSPRRRVG